MSVVSFLLIIDRLMTSGFSDFLFLLRLPSNSVPACLQISIMLFHFSCVVLKLVGCFW